MFGLPYGRLARMDAIWRCLDSGVYSTRVWGCAWQRGLTTRAGRFSGVWLSTRSKCQLKWWLLPDRILSGLAMAYVILFFSALVAATILPLQSEAVLVALLLAGDNYNAALVAVATVGQR